MNLEDFTAHITEWLKRVTVEDFVTAGGVVDWRKVSVSTLSMAIDTHLDDATVADVHIREMREERDKAQLRAESLERKLDALEDNVVPRLELTDALADVNRGIGREIDLKKRVAELEAERDESSKALAQAREEAESQRRFAVEIRKEQAESHDTARRRERALEKDRDAAYRERDALGVSLGQANTLISSLREVDKQKETALEMYRSEHGTEGNGPVLNAGDVIEVKVDTMAKSGRVTGVTINGASLTPDPPRDEDALIAEADKVRMERRCPLHDVQVGWVKDPLGRQRWRECPECPET